MSVAKVIEIISSSKISFDDAVKQGIATASQTINGIASAWIKDQSVEVTAGKVSEYRVSLKLTFVLAPSPKAKGKSK